MRIARGDTLVIATHNAGKLRELKTLFAPFGVTLTSAGELGLPEPVEDGTTFEDNALIKARAAAEASGKTALADDSGLCVEALDGAPGIDTALWGGPDRDWGLAMRKVQDLLATRGARNPDQRRAAFMATLCLVAPGGEPEFFVGKAEGHLVWPPRGAEGHGYDPMFQPDGHEVTFGEMSEAQKHSWAPGQRGLSHRARAFAAFANACLDAGHAA